MRPITPSGANRKFTKPQGFQGKCGELMVRIEETTNGPRIVSWWRPNPAELDALANGGVVELCCVGVQPAVSVGVVYGDALKFA